jgi:predicted kinase
MSQRNSVGGGSHEKRSDAARTMRANLNQVLVLSGTCGSGKSTIAQLLADEYGWTRLSEDEMWRRRFHRNRGKIGSREHCQRRAAVRKELAELVSVAMREGHVVVDATVHEADANSVGEYEALFAPDQITWALRVLHPRLEVAIRRDAAREGWRAGPEGVESLWRKFTGHRFGSHVFIDNSDETAAESARSVLRSLKMSRPQLSVGLHSP